MNGKGESFMGIGLVWLLQRIDKLRSITRAAKDMNMSYMKAHGILSRLEKNMGRQFLVRKRGGAERGGAELTSFAREFISKYDKHEKRARSYVFREFSGMLKELNNEAKK